MAKSRPKYPQKTRRQGRQSAHLVQRVCQAGHELGLHKLGLLVLELALLLDPEGCGLHAKLGDLVGPPLQAQGIGFGVESLKLKV